MIEVLTLTQIDFDYLENREEAAISRTELGSFTDDKDKTAFKKVEELLAELKPLKLYLAWNNRVYPKFEVTKKVVR